MADVAKTPAGLPRDGIANTLLVALGVSLVCSLLVTAAVTLLRPIQLQNEFFFKHRVTVLDLAGRYAPGIDIEDAFRLIDQRIVDLATGEYTDAVEPQGYNHIDAARDPEWGIPIPEDIDDAEIKRRAKYAPVMLVREDGRLDQVIVPVYGTGMWSTLYGYLAIAPDGNTVRGLRIYEHGETPGIGDQVEDPEWLALWQGKRLYDEDGDVRIRVSRRKSRRPNAALYEIDGMSGATITGRGVTNMVRYWAGPHGYGPFLKRMAEEHGNDG